MPMIQISDKLKKELDKRKVLNDSYETVLWDLINDTEEISEDLIKRLEISKKQIEEGKIHSFEEIKKKHGL